MCGDWNAFVSYTYLVFTQMRWNKFVWQHLVQNCSLFTPFNSKQVTLLLHKQFTIRFIDRFSVPFAFHTVSDLLSTFIKSQKCTSCDFKVKSVNILKFRSFLADRSNSVGSGTWQNRGRRGESANREKIELYCNWARQYRKHTQLERYQRAQLCNLL